MSGYTFDFYEGYATNMGSYFYLDNQATPWIKTPILLLYSGTLFNFEKPDVGTELEILGDMYKITRIIPPQNLGNPNVNIYYVWPLEKNRTTVGKNLPHDQWEFLDI